MMRIVSLCMILAGLAACTGLGSESKRGDTTSQRYVSEPSTAGINVSGQVRIGVSTVN